MGVNVSIDMSSKMYGSLLQKNEYNKAQKFFSDDMALANPVQRMDLLSQTDNLKQFAKESHTRAISTRPSTSAKQQDQAEVADPLHEIYDDWSPFSFLDSSPVHFPDSPGQNLSPEQPSPNTAEEENENRFTIIPDPTPPTEHLAPAQTAKSPAQLTTTVAPAQPPQPWEEAVKRMMATIKDLQQRIDTVEKKDPTNMPSTSQGPGMMTAPTVMPTPRTKAATTEATPSPNDERLVTPSTLSSPSLSGPSSAMKVSEAFKDFKFCPSPRKDQIPPPPKKKDSHSGTKPSPSHQNKE